MLAPFVLHVAKYSKKLHKEPKEDFVILSGNNKIKPEFVPRGEKYVKLTPRDSPGRQEYDLEVMPDPVDHNSMEIDEGS